MVYGGGDFVTKLLNFFAFPLIAAALSPIAYGTLELIMSATGLLAVIANCGLNNAVSLFYFDKNTTQEDRPRIVTSGFVALLGFCLVCITVGLAAVPFLMPVIKRKEMPVTWVALLAALLLMALTQWLKYILDVMRLHFAPFRFLTVSLVSRVVSIFAGLWVVVKFGFGVDGLLSAQVVVMLLIIPFALYMIRRDFNPRLIDRMWVKTLTRIGSPFIFASLAYWVFGAMDRWMLAALLPEENSIREVGVYSVSFRLASVVLFVSMAFGRAWDPIAYKLRTSHPESYRDIYGKVLVSLLFFMTMIGGGVALFSGELISLLMPHKYLGSALPLSILCFGIILQSTQQVTMIGISLEKKTFLFARLSWFTAAVNFVLNYVLIPKYGGAGAAWATAASNLVLTGSYFYWTQKLHPFIVHWKPFIAVLFSGILIFATSIKLQAYSFDPVVVVTKCSIILICGFVCLFSLPISFRDLIKRNVKR